MSLADFAFPPQPRIRTVSQQLRGLSDGSGPAHGDDDSGALAWGDWGSTGYSPDRTASAQQPYQDPYADLMSENAFDPNLAYSPRQASGHAMPTFDATMHLAGGDDEPAQYQLDSNHFHPPPDGSHPPPPLHQPLPLAQPAQVRPYSSHDARYRAASASELTTPRPLPPPPPPAPRCSNSATRIQSHPASPSRSRASSLQSSNGPTPLHMSVLTSPSSPFFPGPLPSPFHDNRSSFSSSTMNPSHSVRRSSSPSDSSSVSNLNMSRLDSSSATSSIYGGDSGSTAPSTPYRSGSISRQNSQRGSSQMHARRRSSPIKTSGRHHRKLSNAERKAICEFSRTHPGWKQDDIGAHFGYERSTISKTLKHKDRYLAMDSADEAGASAVQAFLHTGPYHQQQGDDRDSSEAPSPAATHIPSSSTPQPSFGLVASSSTSSLVSLGSTATADLGASTSSTLSSRVLSGGRFPHIDNALVAWAESHVAKGNSLADSVLQRQARSIARDLPGNESFKASQSWLDGFKTRAGIVRGAFVHDRAPSPMAPALSNAQRSLDPPREEDDEEDDLSTDAPVRRSKRSIGSKTVRRLASAKSTLAAFAEGFAGRSSSPAAASSSRMDTELASGSFGDLSMDSEATPTHSTVHSRASTQGAERAPQLAQPFSYSPDDGQGTGTPSRASHYAGQDDALALGRSLGAGSDYSPPDGMNAQAHAAMYGGGGAYAGGLTQPYSPHDLGASYSSAQGVSASSSRSSLGTFPQQQGMYGTASPVPSNQHRRSGSTASSTSVYSGLTAFSSQNGPGTPLSGSMYGSFRDSQGNLCASVPGTPANPTLGSSTSSAAPPGSYFGSEQAQLQNSFLSASASGAGTTPTSQYSTLASSSSSSLASASQPFQQQQQHQQQQRYPHPSPAYPQASFDTQQQQQASATVAAAAANRRSTISGGLPFNGAARNSVPSSAAMTPSSSFGAGSRTSMSGGGAPVTLEQAFSSLEIALEYLSTRAGQDYVSPKDLVVLADLRGKMERARNAQGVNLAAISSAPATPSGLGPSGGGPSFHAPFMPSQVNASFAAAVAANNMVGPAKQQRMRLSRTQSTSSVPFFGGGGPGGVPGRRPGSSLSLYEVDGH
ncbi:hypothetical protein JCM8208_007134 [Rhodotorula glutinis]